LKQIDHRRSNAGMLDATFAERQPVVQTEKQISATRAQVFHLPMRRTIAHFNRHFFQVLGKLLRQPRQRRFHQLAEPRLAHMMRQAIIRPFHL
jgi:hypothetical protein